MKLKLVKTKLEARGTRSFFWETEKKVSYLPGQYFYFTLPKLSYPDLRGATRHFTLSSSPTEGDIIRFTTRMRETSGFKKTLAELKVGDTIEGEGPSGTFILDEKEKGPHVLLAGGIGITPFRSIIKYAADKKTGEKINLVYTNSIPEEIAFRKELENWAGKSRNIEVEMTITKPNKSKRNWKGLVGRINEKMIKELTEKWQVKNGKSTTWWLCGPPFMVEAMEKVLGNLRTSIGQVRSEKFSGY